MTASMRLSRKMVGLVWLLLMAAQPVSSPAGETDSVLVAGIPGPGTVSRVYADGRIERIDVPGAGRGSASAAYGSNDPTPSPDNRHIAYLHLGEPWILDTRSNTRWKVSPDAELSGVFFTAWSWDGRRLLFYLQPPKSAQPSREEVLSRMLSADPRGFRIYDIAKRKAEPVAIELPEHFAFAAWLRDQSFLLTYEGGKAFQPLYRWRPGQGKPEIFVSNKARYNQLRISRDGKKIVALASSAGKVEIVGIDAATGTLVRLAPSRPLASYNWPSLSADGAQLAYLLSAGIRKISGRIANVGYLTVDEENIAPVAGISPSFAWVGSSVIILSDDCDVSVIDVRYKKILSRHASGKRDSHDRAVNCAAREAIQGDRLAQ